MQMKLYCAISVLMQTTYFRFFPDIANLLYTLLLFYHLQGVHTFSIDDPADLECLFLGLCCKQYKSGIDCLICVILRYDLSGFVCVYMLCFSKGGFGVGYCKMHVSMMFEMSSMSCLKSFF